MTPVANSQDRIKRKGGDRVGSSHTPSPVSGPAGHAPSAEGEISPKGGHALIFISSACIMTVEIVAGRLIARHLGSSLYTWTSIIAVILAGMSLGNHLGGRLADRHRAQAILGWLFMGASITCLSALFLNHLFTLHTPLVGFSWPWRVFLSVLVIFMLPALALGMITPVAATLALQQTRQLGRGVGFVYACGAVGSIAGTLATGFWLIAWLGARGVVLAVALLLASTGFLLGPRRWIHLAWTLCLLAMLVWSRLESGEFRAAAETIGLNEESRLHFSRESHYQLVRVRDWLSAPDHSRGFRELMLDDKQQGLTDMTDPGHLEYGYERLWRVIAEHLFRDRPVRSAFCIGGGSYTFPRWLLGHWPGVTVDVSELDPVVVEANHQALGLSADTPIRTFAADARNVLDDMPTDRRYDLIIGDAFRDLAVPFHLSTLEFTRKVAQHQEQEGAYLVNLVDDFRHGHFAGAYFQTVRRVYPHVYAFCIYPNGITGGGANFVICGMNRPMEVSSFIPDGGTDFHAFALTPDQLHWLARQAGGRILTDDNAPVDFLLKPVVCDYRKRAR